MKQFKIFLGAFLFLVFWNCNKIETNIPIHDLETRSNCSGLSDSEINSLGLFHNNYLDTLFQACESIDSDDLMDSIRSTALKLDLNFTALGKSKIDIIDSAIIYCQLLLDAGWRINKVPSHFFQSDDVRTYSIEICNLTDTVQSRHNFNISVEVIAKRAELDTNLSCIELETIKGMISVSKSSFYYWAPTEMGGLGKGNNLGGDKIYARSWSWKKAFTGDVAAAGSHMLSNAVAWSVGWAVPGVNTAILGAWAVSTAIGSVSGGLM